MLRFTGYSVYFKITILGILVTAWSVFLLAAFEIHLSNQQMARLLLRHIYVFKYLPWQKKCWGNKIHRNLKIILLQEWKIFLFKKENKCFSFNKKVIFVFHTIYKIDFTMQIIYCIYPQTFVLYFYIFSFFYISF